jgi:hypothetical protein
MAASTIFGVSFLGALFAILASLLIVYTYVMLRLFPKLKRGFHEMVEDLGPRALFEQARVDPAEALRDLGIPYTHPESRIVYTCEDHGRCVGCPKVLAQFEAIIKHQGAESFDSVERSGYAELRAQLAQEHLTTARKDCDKEVSS